jgi:hypothetical protein
MAATGKRKHGDGAAGVLERSDEFEAMQSV